MTKSLLASVLASTLALTSLTATPVRAADTGEIGRFLLGAGTLFIIGSAIANSQNKNTHVTRHAQPKVVVRPSVRKFVPSACLRVNKYNHGPRRYFGRQCLRNNMAQAHRLPGGCLRTVWTKHGHRSVYSAKCLRSHGWRYS
jgi:hypothetical protein